MSETPRVGEILVQAGVIDEMQLSSALGEQTRWGRRLGVTLIKLGMVEEGHLVRALAKQLDLPVASLAGKRIADDVIALVPAKVASEHAVIPLFVKEEGRTRQLFLGMEDPSNLAVLDDLSFRTGMEVHPVMVGPTELGQAMDRYYLGGSKPSVPEPVGPDAVSSGTTMGELSLRIIAEDEGESPPVPAVAVDTASETPPPLETSASGVSGPELPEGLLDDISYAIDETERTRIVAKAIVQLLIEKGVLTLDEVQAKLAQMKGESSA